MPAPLITLLAIGSQGDVQPFIALGEGLLRSGLRVRLVAPDDFAAQAGARGLDFFSLGFNLQQIVNTSIRPMLESGSNVIGSILQVSRMLLPLMETIFSAAWQGSQGSALLAASSFGLPAYHIAEKLGIPCLWGLPFPIFQSTRAYPNLVFPALPLGGSYNRLTHILFNQFGVLISQSRVNAWRKKDLGLPPIALFKWPYDHLHGSPVPTLMAYSPAVVPPPPDWPPHVHVTGYWFLNSQTVWQPPEALLRFLQAGPSPVYVGFGSMSYQDPRRAFHLVREALNTAGQRGIFAAGWSGLAEEENQSDNLLVVQSIPHDWLFPRMAAAVHHGGAGTTAAALRAGIPAVIVPHGVDQFFWARTVAGLNASPPPLPRSQLNAARLAARISSAVNQPQLRQAAAALGRQVQSEDGVGEAVKFILENL